MSACLLRILSCEENFFPLLHQGNERDFALVLRFSFEGFLLYASRTGGSLAALRQREGGRVCFFLSFFFSFIFSEPITESSYYSSLEWVFCLGMGV